MTTYETIKETTLESLTQSVNNFMQQNEGAQPQGGICFNGVLYIQAMVYYIAQ